MIKQLNQFIQEAMQKHKGRGVRGVMLTHELNGQPENDVTQGILTQCGGFTAESENGYTLLILRGTKREVKQAISRFLIHAGADVSITEGGISMN